MVVVNSCFAQSFESQTLIGDTMSSGTSCSLIMLHGGGSANRNRFLFLRQALAQSGIGSLAFDFIGSGDSTGSIHNTSLHNRTRQAEAVISRCKMPMPVSIVGASMGAYTAVQLTARVAVANLILFVPAMYTAAAYRVPFGPEFSRLIRQPQSWVESDAWGLLDRFAGRLLVIAAARDNVIPTDVIHRIMDAAVSARSAQLMTLSNTTHQILSDLAAQGAPALAQVADPIVRMCAQF